MCAITCISVHELALQLRNKTANCILSTPLSLLFFFLNQIAKTCDLVSRLIAICFLFVCHSWHAFTQPNVSHLTASRYNGQDIEALRKYQKQDPDCGGILVVCGCALTIVQPHLQGQIVHFIGLLVCHHNRLAISSSVVFSQTIRVTYCFHKVRCCRSAPNTNTCHSVK